MRGIAGSRTDPLLADDGNRYMWRGEAGQRATE